MTERVRLLEEKLELTEKENEELSNKFVRLETTLAETEARCPLNNNDNNISNNNNNNNSEQTIVVLMKLLNNNKGKLLSCRKKVKNQEKENSGLKSRLTKANKKLSKSDSSLKEAEKTITGKTEQLEAAQFDVSFCKAELQDKEIEKNEFVSKLNLATEKIDDLEKVCSNKTTENIWTENSDEELNTCRKKFEKEMKREQEEVWEKAWKKQDYGLCVKACNMMKNAACKLAFNFFPFKGYLLDCS